MKTIILVATQTELELCRRYLNERQISVRPLLLYCTGIGRTNVLIKLLELMRQFREDISKCAIVNIGLCGTNREQDKRYDILRPVNFKDGDRDWSCEFVSSDLYPMKEDENGPTLVSSSKFVTKEEPDGYVYDMEAFDIYAFCREYLVPFECIKIVSDYCNSKSEDDYNGIDKELMYSKFKEALDGSRWIK